MKIAALLLTLAMSVGCSSPSGDANAPENVAEAVTTTPSGSTAASASGVIKEIDVAARTITIAHGPVDALKWPAMTMTFKAPDTDLGSIKQGDRVAFEFTSTGMNGTITRITPQ